MQEKIKVIPIFVVGLIGAMLIFGFFLPQSEKCQLFPDLPSCAGTEGGLVLSDSTGLLVPSESAARYSFDDVSLFRRDSLDIQSLFTDVSTSKGWFSSASAKTPFEVKEGGTDVKLFLFVNSARGALKVKVNGRTIQRIRGTGVKEVSIPVSKLKASNTLELSSSLPFLPLWTNKHSVGQVSLREEYTITQNRFSQNFTLKQDVAEVERAILKFDTACYFDSNLTVLLNGKEVVDDKICVGVEKDVSDYLKSGNNVLTFASDGNYIVKDIRIDVAAKQKAWPTYYFDIPAGRLDRIAYLRFVFNDTEVKKLTAYLNGKPLTVETRKLEWQSVINKYLVEGQNSIILIPETELVLNRIELK